MIFLHLLVEPFRKDYSSLNRSLCSSQKIKKQVLISWDLLLLDFLYVSINHSMLPLAVGICRICQIAGRSRVCW